VWEVFQFRIVVDEIDFWFVIEIAGRATSRLWSIAAWFASTIASGIATSIAAAFRAAFTATSTTSSTATSASASATIRILVLVFFNGFGLFFFAGHRSRWFFANTSLSFHAASGNADDVFLIFFEQNLAQVFIDIWTSRCFSIISVSGLGCFFKAATTTSSTTAPTTSATSFGSTFAFGFTVFRFFASSFGFNRGWFWLKFIHFRDFVTIASGLGRPSFVPDPSIEFVPDFVVTFSGSSLWRRLASLGGIIALSACLRGTSIASPLTATRSIIAFAAIAAFTTATTPSATFFARRAFRASFSDGCGTAPRSYGFDIAAEVEVIIRDLIGRRDFSLFFDQLFFLVVFIFIIIFVFVVVVIQVFIIFVPEVEVFIVLFLIVLIAVDVICIVVIVIGEHDQVIEIFLVLHTAAGRRRCVAGLGRHAWRCSAVGRSRSLPRRSNIVIVVKKHLTAHIGRRQVQPEKGLRQISSRFVGFLPSIVTRTGHL
jgi:hypothetical protein